jgi:squalene monooxygenase
MSASYDVAVVGGGPGGCATAIASARRGARVLLLEAGGAPLPYLAGEWLHPPGVQMLAALGVDMSPTTHAVGRGFVVFPHDGSSPISLPYEAGEFAISCMHQSLVARLQAAAAELDHIRLARNCKVVGVNGNQLTYVDTRRQAPRSVHVKRIVGADGRSSIVRRSLRMPSPSTALSRTAGLLLDNAELPFEGYGHILLGGPGPILLYRVGPQQIRACIDVPLRSSRAGDASDFLWSAYAPAFPAGLRAALQHALRNQKLKWATNRYRARQVYGHGDVALVGDAVGHFHPLTAAGLTMALLDGAALARAPNLTAYALERAKMTHVPEMLAIALYEVFTIDDPATIAIRRAIYELWRNHRYERDRTMRLLCLKETRVGQFSGAFLHVMRIALRDLTSDLPASLKGRRTASTTRGLAGWLGWFVRATNPLHKAPRPVGRTPYARHDVKPFALRGESGGLG